MEDDGGKWRLARAVVKEGKIDQPATVAAVRQALLKQGKRDRLLLSACCVDEAARLFECIAKAADSTQFALGVVVSATSSVTSSRAFSQKITDNPDICGGVVCVTVLTDTQSTHILTVTLRTL